MSEPTLYLRPNVVAEPLVDRWYAWAHIIAPATAAMNIADRHVKIMESYVKSPHIHAAATRNPAMFGGPFIDYQGKRVNEIQALLNRTKSKRAGMLQLAEALRTTDEMLRKQATGYSLEPLYAKVPELLRGYVELVYDLNNHPSFRLIEPLLYRSEYYRRDSQTLALSLLQSDDRPFILSTPRLDLPGEQHVDIPFDDERIDDLFRLKRSPEPLGSIREKLGLDEGSAKYDENLFRSFFTPEPPAPYEPYRGTGIRWRYFGHACILIETKDISILLDPVLSYTYESQVSRYTYEDLPDSIDFVLITHNHQDHISFETMLQLRHKVGNIVVPRNNGGALQDPSLRHLLRTVGFENVIELDELDSIDLELGSITAVPFFGEHADLDIRSKLAYLVRLGRHSLFFAADSCNVEPRLYDRIRDVCGDIDVLFLGMECDGAPLSWLYGPLLTQPVSQKIDQSRRLSGSNYQRGRNIVDCFGFREVYVYAMGLEPWLTYISSKRYTETSVPIVDSGKLIEDCQERGIVAERLFGEKEILMDL